MLEARKNLFNSNIAILPYLKKNSERTKWVNSLERTIKNYMHKDHAVPTAGDIKSHVMDQLRKAGAPIHGY